MPDKKPGFLLIISAIVLLVTAGLLLVANQPAQAQCGSQASSCKNCHEVQGKLPVNKDGTEWHTAHAFGDFCYICHAGNNQSMDANEAHAGMEPPLADIKASCQQCHPNDLEAKAQVYADILGVGIGAGAAPAPSSGAPAAPSGSDDAAAAPAVVSPVSAPAGGELVVDDANLVDYVKRYEQIVLGKKPFNLGNTILLILIGMVAVGGGGFILYYEFYQKLARKPVPEGALYPQDALDMLPLISQLKPQSRRTLKGILENQQKTERVLKLMDTLVSDEASDEVEP